MALFESLGTVSYLHFVATMAISSTFVRYLASRNVDLEKWVRSSSSSMKMAPFDRHYTSFCWSAIVSIAYTYNGRGSTLYHFCVI